MTTIARPSALWVSSIICAVSFAMAFAAFGLLLTTRGRTIELTTTRAFSDWRSLMDFFRGLSQYDPSDPLLSSARFRRVDENVSAEPGGPLQRLMDLSWCAQPALRPPEISPMNRSRGCECIHQAYAGFLADTANGSASVDEAIREDYAQRVLGCLRFRSIWRTEQCGDFCRMHPLAMGLYLHSVFFLLSASYLIFRFFHDCGAFGPYRYGALKGIVAGLGIVMATLLLISGWMQAFLCAMGIGVVTVTMLYTLSDELDFFKIWAAYSRVERERGMAPQVPLVVPPEPHPFMVCLWANVQATPRTFLFFFAFFSRVFTLVGFDRRCSRPTRWRSRSATGCTTTGAS